MDAFAVKSVKVLSFLEGALIEQPLEIGFWVRLLFFEQHEQ
jgi:hypothetical protein